jgi:hypothetical protein
MDVANYLSELLMQNGEVTVPGLGYFVQIKVDGYYDSDKSKFYPPGNKIQFDPQYHDDDVLLQYIADKKNISLASSKYFTAKFIDNLRQEAMVKEVPLANLGTLHFEDINLIFKPAAVLPVDPTYYGYQPVVATKLGGTSFREQLEKEMQPSPTYVPVPPLPAPEPAVPIGAPPVTEYVAATTESEIFAPQPNYNPQPAPDHEEEFIFSGRGYSDEPVEKNHNWIWITITIVVVSGIIGAFTLYKLKPNAFNRLLGVQTPSPLVLKTPLKQDTTKTTAPAIKVDTATSPAKKAVVDTIPKPVVVNKPASGVDSTKVRYEVIGGSTESLAAANKVVSNYKTLEIDAHIVDATPGKRNFKVSLGTYSTREEADQAISNLKKTGKVSKDIWRLTVKPKK